MEKESIYVNSYVFVSFYVDNCLVFGSYLYKWKKKKMLGSHIYIWQKRSLWDYVGFFFLKKKIINKLK
jgi:acid phosphatase class B